MKSQSKMLAACAATLVLFVSAPHSAAADVTEAQISSARTPADHEAIARMYDADALAAEGKAREHEVMANAYQSAGSPKAGKNSMVRHCERLVKEYTSVATDYRALAAEHRRMAENATK